MVLWGHCRGRLGVVETMNPYSGKSTLAAVSGALSCAGIGNLLA